MDSSFPVGSHAHRSSVVLSRSHASPASLFSLVPRTHVKDLSLKAVTSTGMGAWSGILAVLALKSLQNAMMLSPACPRAGPTGGEGFACPAGISSRMRRATSFAAIVRQHVVVVCVWHQLLPKGPCFQSNPQRPRSKPNSPPFNRMANPGQWERCVGGSSAAVLPRQVVKGL